MFSVQSLCFCGEDCSWSLSSRHKKCRNWVDFQWSSWRSHGHAFGVGTTRSGCWTAAERAWSGAGVWSSSLLLPVSGTREWSWSWFLVFLHLTVVAEHCRDRHWHSSWEMDHSSTGSDSTVTLNSRNGHRQLSHFRGLFMELVLKSVFDTLDRSKWRRWRAWCWGLLWWWSLVPQDTLVKMWIWKGLGI